LPENGLKLRKVLDEKTDELAKETEPTKRDLILGQMIRATGYRLEEHCDGDPLFKMKVSLTLTGYGVAIGGLATILWWLIQLQIGG